jgi:hypothetical protein
MTSFGKRGVLLFQAHQAHLLDDSGAHWTHFAWLNPGVFTSAATAWTFVGLQLIRASDSNFQRKEGSNNSQ